MMVVRAPAAPTGPVPSSGPSSFAASAPSRGERDLEPLRRFGSPLKDRQSDLLQRDESCSTRAHPRVRSTTGSRASCATSRTPPSRRSLTSSPPAPPRRPRDHRALPSRRRADPAGASAVSHRRPLLRPCDQRPCTIHRRPTRNRLGSRAVTAIGPSWRTPGRELRRGDGARSPARRLRRTPSASSR